MGESFGDLLDRLIEVRDGSYRSEPERIEHLADTVVSTLQTMLEKLRDLHDR